MTRDQDTATLPARCRLKTQRDFRRVYRRGRRASGSWLTVVGHLSRARDLPRVGLSVSKEHGRAVRRNKIKRLLREAFRAERHRLPRSLDIVLIPKRRDDRFPLQELRAELIELVGRLLGSPQPKGPRQRRRGDRR